MAVKMRETIGMTGLISYLDKAWDHAISDQVVEHWLQQVCNPPLEPPLINPPHLQHSRLLGACHTTAPHCYGCSPDSHPSFWQQHVRDL